MSKTQIVVTNKSALGKDTTLFAHNKSYVITGQNLDWMSFGARQYDPQIGRFLSVDTLACKQDIFSSYAAMGNQRRAVSTQMVYNI